MMSTLHVCCPGIPDYSLYKSAIGFDTKGVTLCSIPPGHVRHMNCPLLMYKKTKQQSTLCPECLKLKKRLAELKKSHETMSEQDKHKRASHSSKVPNRYLSPTSFTK